MADRLAPLVVERGFDSFLDFYYLLKYDAAAALEWHRVMDALSVPETYFWREIDQIRGDRAASCRSWSSGRGRPIRIWSVPCATGEEPLTIAMVLERSRLVRPGADRDPRQRRAALRRSRRRAPDATASGRSARCRRRCARSTSSPRTARVGAGADAARARHLVERRQPDGRRRRGAVHARRRSCSAATRSSTFRRRRQAGRRRVRRPRCRRPAYLCVGASESLLSVTDRFELEELDGAFVYVKRERHR